MYTHAIGMFRCPLFRGPLTISLQLTCYHLALLSRGAEEIILFRAKDYTREITQAKFHCKVPLKMNWKVPVKIHWKSVNPLENTTEK